MSAIETARKSWGETLPDWIQVLAEQCDKTSQNKMCQKIGWSAATISQVLNNIYPGTIENVEKTVRSTLMDSRHDCPIYGSILVRDCNNNQTQTFPNSGNPTKIRLFKACRNCKFNQKNEGEK